MANADVTSAQSGDRQACVAHILGNHNDADDATQETFIRAYGALSSFDGRSEFSTWLYRIAINTALNFRRKARRTEALGAIGATSVSHVGGRPESLANDPKTPQALLEQTAGLRRVFEKICELSPTLRVTLILASVEALPHSQIAEILGIPEGTVAWRINEARKLLKISLAASDAAGEKSGQATNFSLTLPKI
jgi:RNA polymerase sigma-70 factor, ECF subfamily